MDTETRRLLNELLEKMGAPIVEGYKTVDVDLKVLNDNFQLTHKMRHVERSGVRLVVTVSSEPS